MNYGDILWYNVLRDATPVESVVSALATPLVNALDWRDFSLYHPEGNCDFTVTLTATRTIDAVFWWVAVPKATAYASLQWESSPGVFTTVATLAMDVAGMFYTSFTGASVPSGRKVKVVFVNNSGTELKIRQIVVGQKMVLPIGEWEGKTPHALQSGHVVENVISMNGSIIARNVRRLEKSGSINLEYLTQAWVRSTWEPFAAHAIRYPFIYRWNPTEYPTDVIFAAADQINAPTNGSPAPTMKVSMPFKGITS